MRLFNLVVYREVLFIRVFGVLRFTNFGLLRLGLRVSLQSLQG